MTRRLIPLGPMPDVFKPHVIAFVLPFLPMMAAAMPFRLLGYAALALLVLVLARYAHTARESDTRIAAILLASLVAYGLTFGELTSPRAPLQVAQIVLVCFVIWVGGALSMSDRASRIALSLLACVTILLLLSTAVHPGVVFLNSNSAGAAGLCAFAVAAKLSASNGPPRGVATYSALLSTLALVVGSGSRACILAALIVAASMVASKCNVGRTGRLGSALVIAATALFLPFIVDNPQLAHTRTQTVVVASKVPAEEIAEVPSPAPNNWPGKTLVGKLMVGLSSRDVIWATVLQEIRSNEYKGRGLGHLPSEVLRGRFSELSAHNGFLQLLFQFGAAGVAIYLVAVAALIATLARRPARDVGLAVLVCALVYDTFEVALLQNNIGAGLSLWMTAVIQVDDADKPMLGQGGMHAHRSVGPS